MSVAKRTIALGLVVLATVGIFLRSRRAPVAAPPASVPSPATTATLPPPPPVTPAPVAAPTPAPVPVAPPAVKLDPNNREQMRNLAIRNFQSAPLRMAAFRAHLEFTEAELEKMLDEVSDFKHAIAVVDAPFARILSFDGNALVVQIAAHPAEGATVRDAFARQIRKDFPAERAEQIVAGLPALSALFDYFGEFTMTYTVERPRADDQVRVVVRATPTNPNDAEAAKKAMAMSGDGWMSRDLLEMENEILIKPVDTYFPKPAGTGN